MPGGARRDGECSRKSSALLLALAPLFALLLFFLLAARTVGAASGGTGAPVRRALPIAALAICLGFDSLLARYRAAPVRAAA